MQGRNDYLIRKIREHDRIIKSQSRKINKMERCLTSIKSELRINTTLTIGILLTLLGFAIGKLF